MKKQQVIMLASRSRAGSQVRTVCLAAALAATVYPIVSGGLSTPLAAAPPETTAKRASLAAPDLATRSKLARSYGRLPLSFEANRGQTDPRVKFLSRGRGYQIFLTPDETVLSLKKPSAFNSQTSSTGNAKSDPRNPNPESLTPEVLRMKLTGASKTAALEGQEKLSGTSNYFIGKDPAQWRTQIPNFRRVVAKQVYPGVDLVYYGQGRQLEYDFVIAPGGDPRAIRFALEAGDSKLETGNWKIDPKGDLVAALKGGEVRFRKPVVYQEKSSQPSAVSLQQHPNPELPTPDPGSSNLQSSIGNRQFVDGRYVLLADNRVGFQVGAYDKSRPLVIDPVLSYSTYLGGSEIDSANAIAVGSDGTAFIAGETDSLDFPVEHALQPNAGGPSDFPNDAFVAKLSADGSTVLYATFLGGARQERATGIAVDTFGNAYVTGTTISQDYPGSIGAADPNCGNDARCDATTHNGAVLSDAFATKLNPEGSALIYSTFISHRGPILLDQNGDPVLDSLGQPQATGANDLGFGIAVDLNGNAYVVGTTDFSNFPPSPSALQDAFLVKISAAGAAFLYFADVGGSSEDQGYGVAVDSAGNAYITGITYSANFPVTGTAFQGALAGDADAFLIKLDPAAAILYATYMGGSQRDSGSGIAVDATGNAYVAGVTNSMTFPVTAGVVGPTCDLGSGTCLGDVFVSKFDATQAAAASLLYSTYVGGSGADSSAAIALDTATNAYVTGFTSSNDFPALGVPFQDTYGGGNTDAYIFKLDPAAASLVYSSYLGGSNAEEGKGIAVDVNENAYVAGQTCSTDFPPARPLQDTPGGNCDAFVTKVRVGPDIDVKPTTIPFGAQAVGTTSNPPQIVTITSIGDSPLNIGAITISGDFSKPTDGCSNTSLVNKGDSCTFTVAFAPASIGPKTGQVLIPNNVTTDIAVSLTGSGTTLSITPTQVFFGDQPVATPSAVQTVTLINTGAGAVTIFGIDASGDFAQNNDCTNSLAPNTPCTISITFTPTDIGLRAGAITITDDDPTSPQTVVLSGHGTAPIAAVSPSNLAFGNQGVTGVPQPVTITNNGNAPLAITSISITGPFTETHPGCGASLLAGASCTINVNFSPTVTGAATGQLAITDDAEGSPQLVALSGTGVIPVVGLNPGSLAFGEQVITNPASPSDPQTIIVSNTGNAPLNLTGAIVMGVNAGDFTLTNNCPASLLAAESCAMSIIFTPGASGPRLALLQISDDAPASPQTIALTGTGVLAPTASLSTTSLTFPDTAQGATSASQPVTLTNTGSAELLISNIATSSTNFKASSACAASIAPAGGNCVITVTFTPQTSGNLFGTLSITDNAAGSPHVVQLAGNGLAVPNVSLFPVALTFGDQAVNSTSAAQTVTLTNTGGASLAITSVTITGTNGGDFQPSSNTCTGTFAPGAGCAISIVFTPSAAGPRVGTISIADDAPNTPQTVPLAGNGVLPAGIAFNPTSLSFPSATVGTPSAPQTVTLTSSGGGTLNINSMIITGTNASDFSLNHNCGATLAPTLTCTLTVIFTPSAGGSRLANITVTDNAAGSPHTVPLFGAGQTASGNFTLAATPGSNRIFAGSGATYTITVTPLNGFNAQVNLSCSESISLGTCSISPTSVTPDGTNPVEAVMTVTTTARVMAPPAPGPGDFFPRHGLRWAPWLAVLMAMAMLAAARRKRTALLLAALMAIMVFWTACGAGGTTVNVPSGTPAGSYSITITATSGGTTQNSAVSLTVD